MHLIKKLEDIIAKSPIVSGIVTGGFTTCLTLSDFFYEIWSKYTGENSRFLLESIYHFGVPIAVGLGTYHEANRIRESNLIKKHEQDAKKARDDLERVLNNIGDGIMILDENNRIIGANPAMCRMLQYDESELIGKTREFWTHQDDLKEMDVHLEKRKQREQSRYQTRFLRKDKNQIRVFVTGTPIFDDKDNYQGAIGAVKDITFVGGISHDVNNCLSVIIGHIDILRMSLGQEVKGVENLKSLEIITESYRKIINLMKKLVDYSDEKKIFDINPIIQNTLIYGIHVPDSYDLKLNLSSSSQVYCDANQISRIIQNITKNAIEAMPSGGKIEIKTRDSAIRNGNAPLNLLCNEKPEPGNYVLISISDNGPGISLEHIKKITQPYFTTKPAGTGLGLFNVLTIIRENHGYLGITTEPDKGTTFDVYIPSKK